MADQPNASPSNPDRLTPYPNLRFKVKWDGTYVAGVSRVLALSRSEPALSHREAGEEATMHLSPGQTDHAALTLERGMSHSADFLEWANHVYDNDQDTTATGDFRKDLTIDVFNDAGQIVLAYCVRNAWVSEFDAQSDSDAEEQLTVMIQSMTLQNEGWEREQPAPG